MSFSRLPMPYFTPQISSDTAPPSSSLTTLTRELPLTPPPITTTTSTTVPATASMPMPAPPAVPVSVPVSNNNGPMSSAQMAKRTASLYFNKADTDMSAGFSVDELNNPFAKSRAMPSIFKSTDQFWSDNPFESFDNCDDSIMSGQCASVLTDNTGRLACYDASTLPDQLKSINPAYSTFLADEMNNTNDNGGHNENSRSLTNAQFKAKMDLMNQEHLQNIKIGQQRDAELIDMFLQSNPENKDLITLDNCTN